MSELLFTSSIDPVKEGQVFTESPPRHVTVWQYFTLPDFHRKTFLDEVGRAVEGFSPLEIIGGAEDKFGPNNDVPVRRVIALGTGATLITLHAVLGEIIRRYDGVIRDPQYAWEGYNPHVTYVNGKALDEGEYVKLSHIELMEKDDALKQKVVRKVWDFEGTE
ncbi:MAG TPA: hypothetical protein VN081_06265 [Dongiaceae bacterium]|nr:hypothetical protein [Dongiaceae bacterium]